MHLRRPAHFAKPLRCIDPRSAFAVRHNSMRAIQLRRDPAYVSGIPRLGQWCQMRTAVQACLALSATRSWQLPAEAYPAPHDRAAQPILRLILALTLMALQQPAQSARQSATVAATDASRSGLHLSTAMPNRCEGADRGGPAGRLLVTAGYVIDTIHQLTDLSHGLMGLDHSLAVVTEVHHESAVQLGDPTKHALWMVSGPSGALHRFGSQAFGRAEEVPSRDCPAATKLRLQLPDRISGFGDFTLFGLICGEINILQGRHNPKFVCPDARAAILSADIVVNPTHDRMGNGGTLRAKRAVLGAGHKGKDRVYVSCSNWDVSGNDRGRQKPSRTLHTVYRSGEPLQCKELADGSDGFVYRRWTLDR